MAEYKDVEPLKKQIADFKRVVNSPNSDYLTGYISALSTTEGIIAGLPDADVEPVKHGKWSRGTEPSGSVYAHCSACNRKMNSYLYGYRYCPLCGARMDGKARCEK